MTGLTIKEFKKKINGQAKIVDTRSPENFKQAFIPGSLFLGAAESLEEWSRNFVSVKDEILLITDSGSEEEIFRRLENIGFANISGYLKGGCDAWKNAAEKYDMIIDVDVDELAMDLPHDPNLTVVDVRKLTEFAEGHLKGAVNLPLGDMSDVALIAQFEETENLYVHSGSGHRSVIACSLLKLQGYHNLRNVNGGWEEIKKEKSFKTEKEQSILN